MYVILAYHLHTNFVYVDVHLKTIFAVTLALVSQDGVCYKVVFLLSLKIRSS